MIIWLASGNKHKQQELAAILSGHTIKLPSEAGIKSFDPAETGKSFAENALIKARALYQLLEQATKEPGPVLADDSGLCVDVLGGRPGIYSARYYGKNSWAGDGSFKAEQCAVKLKDKERNLLLLEEMDYSINNLLAKAQKSKENGIISNTNPILGVSAPLRDILKRKCRFVCAMVLLFNPDHYYLVQENMEGEIVLSESEIRGAGGFGYDPIVFFPELGRTVAELSEKEKNVLSHRGKAGKAIAKLLL